jgi:uncharacterized protein (DUF2384 family)
MAQPSTDVFSTVANKDYLSFFPNGKPQYKKIVDFLELKKAEVAKATNLQETVIRYDERMPQDLQDRLVQIASVCELVAEYFKGDITKTVLWFKTSNPMLGNMSPRDMIRLGLYKKVLKFILAAKSGNHA